LGSLSVLALAACSQSHALGGDGVCCPVASFSGCSPGLEALPGGGWAPSAADCTYTISGFDGPPFVHVVDAHGCERVEEDWSAPWCGTVVDAGVFPDASLPPWLDAGGTDCSGLGPAACLQRGCLPTFDDSCCPSCRERPCADCQHWIY